MKATLSLSALAIAAGLCLAGCSESTNQQPIASSASATLSGSAIAFGSSPVGMTSATQSVTLTNSGTTSLLFSQVSVSGTNASAFLATSNCPTAIAKGASCNVSVAFAPTATGTLSATLLISDDAINSPQSVTLTGTGTANGPIASFSSTAVTFSTLPVGQSSTQNVIMSNIGSTSLTLNGFLVEGANLSSFGVSGPCVTTYSLAPSATCSLTITYAPTCSRRALRLHRGPGWRPQLPANHLIVEPLASRPKKGRAPHARPLPKIQSDLL